MWLEEQSLRVQAGHSYRLHFSVGLYTNNVVAGIVFNSVAEARAASQCRIGRGLSYALWIPEELIHACSMAICLGIGEICGGENSGTRAEC